MWELLRFAFGVFGLYLALPVLALIDCSFVGRIAGTPQLAALAPGAALCDSSGYVLSCIGVATTNLYAARRARGQWVACQRIASDSLAIGLFCGVALGLALVFSATHALSMFSVDAAVVGHALAYVRIRALGAPLALLTAAAQAVCLGERDSTTPVLVVVLTGTVNVLGDALFVPPYGAAGAAGATVAAQGIGVLFLLQVLRRRRRQRLLLGAVGPFGLKLGANLPLITVPSRKAARRFVAVALPVFIALLGKIIFMNSLTFAAAHLGTVALAAHQVTWNLWLLFCRAGDSLGAAAQAYLPAAMVVRDRLPTRRLILRLAAVSVIWGALNAAVASVLPLAAAGLFTRDPLVCSAVYGVAPLLGAGLMLHCATLMLEGVLLASARGGWLAKVYWLNSLVFVSALQLGAQRYGSLYFVWTAMVAFQVVRLSEFFSRVWLDNWGARAGSRNEAA